MSTWFKDRRQEFIAATLRQFGQIRRADLMRQFDISLPQASNDIAAFLASHPPFVTYDTTAKSYVLNDARKPPRCSICHNTGYVDFACLGLERCDHQPPKCADDSAGLAQLIESRLLGVAPDDQDLQLEDDDWHRIVDALRSDQGDA